jgi:hypothetical protein
MGPQHNLVETGKDFFLERKLKWKAKYIYWTMKMTSPK